MEQDRDNYETNKTIEEALLEPSPEYIEAVEMLTRHFKKINRDKNG